MTRSIQVSTEVFAAIWADRKVGEESEDAILRRNYGLQAAPSAAPPQPPTAVGFVDNRYGVVFSPGREISRIYKGREYRAKASNGAWVRADNQVAYASLNQLSDSIGASENAWDAWFFVDEANTRKPIATLRDPTKVHRRLARSTNKSAEELL